MSQLSQFFLGSSLSLYQYDLLEISHPNFTQTYYIVRNAMRGLVVTHEGGVGPFTYVYYPMRLTPAGNGNDLGQSINIVLGDLGDIIQKEVEAVTVANGMNTRPVCKFRTYRSDILSFPLSGPLVLEISAITTADEGNSFEAHAPKLNNSRTGQIYDLDTFPMLRGFF